MRSVVITGLILVLVGWAAIRIPAGDENRGICGSRSSSDLWRRTADGWEKRTDWPVLDQPEPPIASLHVHPTLLAAFQVLVALFVFVASMPEAGKRDSSTIARITTRRDLHGSGSRVHSHVQNQAARDLV